MTLAKIILSLLLAARVSAGESLSDGDKLELLSSYQRLHAGVSPNPDSEAVRAYNLEFTSELRQLRADLAKIARVPEKCRRFAQVTDQIARQLLGILILPSAPQRSDARGFEISNRTLILATSLGQMWTLMQSNAEGGYSFLDPRLRVQCDFQNRAGILSLLSRLLDSGGNYLRAAYGVSGLEQASADEERLLDMSIQDEHNSNQKLWAITFAIPVASLFIWELGPPAVIATVRIMWGQVPRILTVPATLYATNATALGAEGVAIAYLSDAAVSQPTAPEMKLGSWEEHMNLIEEFLQSPLHSPQIQLALLSRIHLVNFNNEAVLSGRFANEIRSQIRQWGSVENAISHYKEIATHEASMP